jgi:DNA-binding LytR/AlgR family response regulator
MRESAARAAVMKPGAPNDPQLQHRNHRVRLVVPTEVGVRLVPLEHIESIEANRNYAIVHTARGTFRLRATISRLAGSLRHFGFLRVNRQAIVSSQAITEIETRNHRHIWVVLRTGRRFGISRSELPKVRFLWETGILDLDKIKDAPHTTSGAA